MNRMNVLLFAILSLGLLTSIGSAQEIKPTWESLAANYQVPQWFVDGKLGASPPGWSTERHAWLKAPGTTH